MNDALACPYAAVKLTFSTRQSALASSTDSTFGARSVLSYELQTSIGLEDLVAYGLFVRETARWLKQGTADRCHGDIPGVVFTVRKPKLCPRSKGRSRISVPEHGTAARPIHRLVCSGGCQAPRWNTILHVPRETVGAEAVQGPCVGGRNRTRRVVVGERNHKAGQPLTRDPVPVIDGGEALASERGVCRRLISADTGDGQPFLT